MDSWLKASRISTLRSVWRKTWKIAAVCAVATVPPSLSLALPKGNGTHACGCFCYVTLGNGQTTTVPDNFSLPSGYICGRAEGATCNVEDLTTGGIRQGTLEGCSDGSLHVTPLPFKPPVTSPPSGVLPSR